MAEIKKNDGITTPEKCLYCNKIIIIAKKGTGIFWEVKKRCPTDGCPYNKPAPSSNRSSSQSGWGC